MKNLLLLLIGFTIALNCSANESKLYEASVNVKNKNGKDLIMSFKETERKENISLVSLTFESGSSVASSMFIAKGMYKIAKSRNMVYFVNLKEWKAEDGSRKYIVGFSNDKSLNIAEFFGENADTNKKLKFLSTQQFDIIWGHE